MRFMIETRTPGAPEAVEDDGRLLQRIPAGIREVIGKRLNRLTRVLGPCSLAIASCIGRTFELDLLAQLETDKSEDEVLAALEEAKYWRCN